MGIEFGIPNQIDEYFFACSWKTRPAYRRIFVAFMMKQLVYTVPDRNNSSMGSFGPFSLTVDIDFLIASATYCQLSTISSQL